MPNEEAARAAHAALIQTVRELRGEPDYMPPPLSLFSLGLDPWDELPPIEQQFYTYVAAAVLAADPSYAALVIVFGAVVAFLDAQREADRTGTWRQVSAASVRLRDAANELARDHPHLLDAARGQEGQHGA